MLTFTGFHDPYKGAGRAGRSTRADTYPDCRTGFWHHRPILHTKHGKGLRRYQVGNTLFVPQDEGIRDYFENLRRVGVFGHVGSDDDVEELRAAGAIHEDPVSGAEDVILVERMKKLLLFGWKKPEGREVIFRC